MSGNRQGQLNSGEKSRTEYSARNTTVAMFARMLAILLGFVAKVVFTHTLSEEYVGVNGLFTNILNVLTLSEFGIGLSITYALYKPIAEKNIEKQKSLMVLYKRFYRMMAGGILFLGLLLLPFMGYLVKDHQSVEHLTLFYLMYLVNSALSYMFVYKKILIDAHQLSYIGVVYYTVFLSGQYVLQIITLITTKNVVLFLSALLLCTLLNNFFVSRKAERLYPYLKEKQVQELPKEEKKQIYQNIRAMLLHKAGDVAINNTSNLLLSSMIGIVSVGLYSNYYLIIGSVRQVLNQAFQGITASVGNLGVEGGKEQVKDIFEKAFFINQWIFGLAAICLCELLNPFVELSFGEQYVFDVKITVVLCLSFYAIGMRQATLVFRDSLGLFRYDRYKSLIEIVINLVLSMILGHYFGIIGIFVGSLCSTLAVSTWIEPYMLYKHCLQIPVRGYFLRYAVYFLVTGAVGLLTHVLCSKITGGVIFVLFVRAVVCVIVPNVLYLLVYGRSKEFSFIVKKLGLLISRLSKRNGHNK